MNGEHLQDLRQRDTGWPGEANGPGDEFQAVLTDTWAVGCVLAAYDHELFHPLPANHEPKAEAAWSATLTELLGARTRILSELIPRRLMEYRSWNTPVAPVPLEN